jgi:ketosteroid isomerase-like protein
VSAENVELIRSIQPGPEADLVALFADAGAARLADVLAPLLDPGFECAMHLFPGAPPTVYSGLDGLRACWRDWVAPWASYRTEIERLIDLGERVVTVVRDYGRREQSAAEVEMRAAAVYTVQGGRIIRAEFYEDRAEALASVGLAE